MSELLQRSINISQVNARLEQVRNAIRSLQNDLEELVAQKADPLADFELDITAADDDWVYIDDLVLSAREFMTVLQAREVKLVAELEALGVTVK